MKPSTEDRPSPLTRAHHVLEAAQAENGSSLSVELAERKLGATSGLLFAPGTTFMDIFQKLESYNLVKFAGDRKHIQVLDW